MCEGHFPPPTPVKSLGASSKQLLLREMPSKILAAMGSRMFSKGRSGCGSAGGGLHASFPTAELSQDKTPTPSSTRKRSPGSSGDAAPLRASGADQDLTGGISEFASLLSF